MANATDHEHEHEQPVESPPAAADPSVDAQMAALVARFGDRLSPSQREQVRGHVAALAGSGRTMRRVPLTNADEPDASYVPYRRDVPPSGGADA